MEFVAFDFETSGLPEEGAGNAHDTLDRYDTCRAVSLSAARFSADGKVEDTFNKYILPDGTFDEISAKSIELHGLTFDKLEEIGEPFAEVYLNFVKFIGSVRTVVAYNSRFDINVLRSEVMRSGCLPFDEEEYNVVCALKLARRTSYLRGPFTLKNVFHQIFRRHFDGAHNSLEDALATGAVYNHILQNDRPLIFKPIESKTINIRTSEVPTAVGIGFNTTISELIDDVWKRNSASTFTGMTRENEALNIIQSDSQFMNILEDVSAFKSEGGTAINEKITSVVNEINGHRSMDDREKFVAKDYFSTLLRTTKGSEVFSMKDIKTYPIFTIKGTLYQIRGKIDCVQKNDDGSKTILLTVNRTKCFKNVPDYDVPKYQTYMQMIDASSIRVTEKHDGKRRLHLVERDDAMWKDDILPKLKKFCEYFHDKLSTSC